MPVPREAPGPQAIATALFSGSIEVVGGTDGEHRDLPREELQPRQMCVKDMHSDTRGALTARRQSSPAMPSTREAPGLQPIATALFSGSIDVVGGTEELHSNAAREQLQPPNLFVQSLHSDTIEAHTARRQSSPAMPSTRAAPGLQLIATA